MLNDFEMVHLTIYEKKALLVNRELNSHGMGKYQVSFPSLPHSAGLIFATLNLVVVYILLVRLWFFDRSFVRSSFCPRGACDAAGIRLLRYVAKILVAKHNLSKNLDPALGSLFSAFGAGLCAGVSIQTIQIIARTPLLTGDPNRPLSGAFW